MGQYKIFSDSVSYKIRMFLYLFKGEEILKHFQLDFENPEQCCLSHVFENNKN